MGSKAVSLWHGLDVVWQGRLGYWYVESIGLYYCKETGLRRVITVGIEDQFMHEDIVRELPYNLHVLVSQVPETLMVC